MGRKVGYLDLLSIVTVKNKNMEKVRRTKMDFIQLLLEVVNKVPKLKQHLKI